MLRVFLIVYLCCFAHEISIQMSLKLGVILPSSNYIPRLSLGLSEALELGLKKTDVDIELVVESAGYNADKNILLDKINKMVMKDRIDLLTAPVNPGVVMKDVEVFSSHQLPFIINSLGEDIYNEGFTNEYIFINSMNLWESMWATGYWGATAYGKDACTLCALHDGGYGIAMAFAIGLESKEGSLKQVMVTHRESRTEDPSEAIKTAMESNPSFINGLYSGKESISFLNAYRDLGYLGKVPLTGCPFMVDELLLDELGELALGIQTIYSWATDSENPENRQFIKAFREKMGRQPDAYALLAYETGCLVAKVGEQLGDQTPNPSVILDQLNNVQTEGPRGLLTFDPERRSIRTPLYLREVTKNDEGKLYQQTIEKIDIPEVFQEHFAMVSKNLYKQGWLNPYLCA